MLRRIHLIFLDRVFVVLIAVSDINQKSKTEIEV